MTECYTRAVSRLRPLLPYFTLGLFAALAAEPLARAQMTCSDDGSFHLFRALELGDLIQMGQWFPRWSPHMAQGYGYPFYNFYAPLSSYFVVGLHALSLDYVTALKVAFGLTIFFAGVAMFLFAREWWGERAGVVAGVAYLFAPYLAYDVLYRANFAETFAFIWPPLVLWGMQMAEGGGQKADNPTFRLLPSIFYAALILTHNIFALIASPLFIGYALLLTWQTRSWKTLWRCGLSLALGVALTTYFWLPALSERALVYSDRLLVPPIFTWYTNFIYLRELLAPPTWPDALLINPSPMRAIGLVPAGLALTALLVFATRKTSSAQRLCVLFFALALIGYGALTLELARPIWSFIQPLELVQFPWRMLGPAALCTALLIGAGVHASETLRPPTSHLQPLLPSLFSVLLFFSSLAWWTPRYCPTPSHVTIADLVQFERDTFTIGTTAKGEYVPRTSQYLPAAPDLADALIAGVEPDRLQIHATGHWSLVTAPSPLNATYRITLTEPTTATYRQFYYPGWQATLDDQNLPIQSTSSEGLITFDLPAGMHTLNIYFGNTSGRSWANVVSLLAFFVFLILNAQSLRHKIPSPPSDLQSPISNPLILLPPLLLLLLKPFLPAYSAFDGQSVRSPQTPLRLDFTGGVNLYGYDLSVTTLPADGALDATLYVSVREHVERRFWPHFTLEDETGFQWHDPETLPPRSHREPTHTPLWSPDQYAQWARHLALLPGTPPGQYTLYGSVFDIDSLEIASSLDEQGNPVAPRFALGTLNVTRPTRPFALQPEHPAPFTFGALTMLGYDIESLQAKAGDTLRLTLYWKADQTPLTDQLARLELIDANGQSVSQFDVPPVNGYPTSRWQMGDEWRGQIMLPIPATLTSGEYRLRVSVVGTEGVRDLTSLTITAPYRLFTRPPLQFSIGATFENIGVLEGYDLHHQDVTLIWRATATPPASYTAFIHLTDDFGHVLAQNDSVPVGWTRPTTGWVAGEFIVDEHTLEFPADLPAGDYQLWAGLYQTANGLRATASGPGAQADGRVYLGPLSLP